MSDSPPQNMPAERLNRMRQSLERTDGWLRAADMKSTALVRAATLLAAMIGVLIQVSWAQGGVSALLMKLCLFAAAALALSGGFAALLVQKPRMSFRRAVRGSERLRVKEHNRRAAVGELNPLYFVDAAAVTLPELEALWADDEGYPARLLEQLHTTAQIATVKHRHVAHATRLTLASIASLLAATVIMLVELGLSSSL
jgi:hypothetical protein